MTSELLTRKAFLQTTAELGGGALATFFGHGLWETDLFATDIRQSQKKLQPLNRFPRMVQEYFVEKVRQVERRNLLVKNALRTKEDAEKYVISVQQRIRQVFGERPPKTPLKPKITGVLERDEYRIEKLVFESRPNFPVTANLYMPKNRQFPLPAVVGTCGHSNNGKSAEFYQSFSQGLARMGYVVLIYDPIGQGERLQYADKNLKSRVGIGVREHLYAGNPQFLIGEFFGMWRAWDGIRALDYLLSRKEVDPEHVGITGNSGGGTLTTWLCGVEQRWTMAAPGCFVTTFRRNMENELPADTEQCPPQALALGLDHDDFLAALAPKPIVILGKEKDFFDVRGTQEAFQRLKKLYRLLGYEENISLFVGPTYHGYSKENREAMYRWFNKITKISTLEKEPKLKLEDEKDLWCTPHGQVTEWKPQTVYSFNKQKSQELAQKRVPISDRDLNRRILQLLKIEPTSKSPTYRILRNLSDRKYPKKFATNYLLKSEERIEIVVTRLSNERRYSRPPKNPDTAILYVSHHSADAELREEPLIRKMVEDRPQTSFYACDVRGVGESRPNTCGVNSFLSPYGSDYFYAIHSFMLDHSYVGQKTHDLLRVISWLKKIGHRSVHIVAKGWGTIPATFASVLSPHVSQVTLKNSLSSYADIVESETYNWPLSSFLPNLLKHFDLPDCYAFLKRKKLKQIDPWGANGELKSNDS